MIRAGRSTIPPNAARLDRRDMIELLGCYLVVAGIAKVTRVAVDIVATQGERLDMVDLGGEANDIAIKAAFT
jgi:hypothetical protein